MAGMILTAGVILLAVLPACSPRGNQEYRGMNEAADSYAKGTYGYDVAFFARQGIGTVELKEITSEASVLVIPAYQGRVMTSSAEGPGGISFGWINYDLIRSGEVSGQFNPVGGEERFWLGPEGGPYSIYFGEGEEQVFAHWKVPAVLDTEPFEITARGPGSVSFRKEARLVNASGTRFRLTIERTVSLIPLDSAANLLGISLPAGMKGVAYQTDNVIGNTGSRAWTRDGGLLSIWLLSMFNPTQTTTVFIPYRQEGEGTLLNDEYFGKVPPDRLKVANGIIYFKIDGRYRSKIGIPPHRATPLCGSYDSGRKMLTLLRFSLPEEPGPYVNSLWGPQEDPYQGDAINSYNDGPVEDGSIMGPFYELETSSPGAALQPGESLRHTQLIIHLQGDEAALDPPVASLFGLDLKEIASTFGP
jgi:hypothetical protein